MLCILALLGIGVAFLLGNEIQDAPPRKPIAQVWRPAVLIGLVAVVLQNAGNGAGWEYQARVGENLHFSGQVVGSAIAADLIFKSPERSPSPGSRGACRFAPSCYRAA